MKEETSVERIDRKSKENVAKQKAAADAKAAARDKSTAAFQAHKKDVLSKGGRPVDALDSWQKKKLNNSAVDAITFTSGKTALHTAQLLRSHFGNQWEELIDKVKLVSIGPQTSMSCEENFHRVDNEASPHDLEGLAQACIDSLLE